MQTLLRGHKKNILLKERPPLRMKDSWPHTSSENEIIATKPWIRNMPETLYAITTPFYANDISAILKCNTILCFTRFVC